MYTCSVINWVRVVQPQIRAVNKAPKDMTVDELKTELRARRLCTTGNKDILVRRLEGAIADEH